MGISQVRIHMDIYFRTFESACDNDGIVFIVMMCRSLGFWIIVGSTEQQDISVSLLSLFSRHIFSCFWTGLGRRYLSLMLILFPVLILQLSL